jgi:UDP-glucose-4-epimerase GalE
MTHVLVAGGAGYIGSHACKALSAAGFVPVTFDNLEHGHEELVRWGPLIRADITDRARLDIVISEFNPVAVMHFAAYTFVGESVSDPKKYYRNNVVGALTLFEAAVAAGIEAVVFSSTAAVYGVPEVVPIPESAPKLPINPYGRSKLMMEEILRDFDGAYGLRSVCLRYFNAAGADTEGETGEDHEPETHLIPRTLMAAAGEIPHLDLFGTDYDTPDGTAVRDYIHVTDLADAHVRALAYLRGGGASDSFNLGTGRGFSVREIIAATERSTGLQVPVKEAPRRAGDPPQLVADPARAREKLGLTTEHSDIDSVVGSAWRWYRARRSTGERRVAV